MSIYWHFKHRLKETLRKCAEFTLVEGARGRDISLLGMMSYDPLELYASNISGIINIYQNRETMPQWI